jgi:hypothetical protein
VIEFGVNARGKRPVSPAIPLPSSADGSAIGGRDWCLGQPLGAAPAKSVAAAKIPDDGGAE